MDDPRHTDGPASSATPPPDVAGGVPTVVVVDDHPIATEGLRIHLAGSGFTVDTAAAVEQVPRHHLRAHGTVAVCDLRLPGRSGEDAVAFLVAGGVTVLATSGVATADEVLDAVASGARGFLAKTAPVATFADAVRTLAAGRHHLSPELAHYFRLDIDRRPLEADELDERSRSLLADVERGDTVPEAAARRGIGVSELDPLLAHLWEAAEVRRRRYRPTAREREVLRRAAEGSTHRALALELHVSVHTVPDLLNTIKDKYLRTHPEADPSTPPMTIARRWARELGLG